MAQRPSILQFEQAFLSAWPAAQTHADQGWIWRCAGGFTKRANCAQSMDPEDEAHLADRLTDYAAWARAHGSEPVFRVTPLAGEKIIAELNQHHWEPYEQSVVMAMPIGAIFTPKHRFKLFEATDPEWYEVQARMNGYTPQTITALHEMLERIVVPSIGVLVFDDDGAPAAAALANDNDGIGVYLNVVVRQQLRGAGYGRSVMQTALNWSRRLHTQWAAVQVVASNIAAIQLYRSLGFSEIYRYHYRRRVT